MNKIDEIKYLKHEISLLTQQLEQNNNVDNSGIQELVEIAQDMRLILISCRKEQINIGIAKNIDIVLKRADYLMSE